MRYRRKTYKLRNSYSNGGTIRQFDITPPRGAKPDHTAPHALAMRHAWPAISIGATASHCTHDHTIRLSGIAHTWHTSSWALRWARPVEYHPATPWPCCAPDATHPAAEDKIRASHDLGLIFQFNGVHVLRGKLDVGVRSLQSYTLT